MSKSKKTTIAGPATPEVILDSSVAVADAPEVVETPSNGEFDSEEDPDSFIPLSEDSEEGQSGPATATPVAPVVALASPVIRPTDGDPVTVPVAPLLPTDTLYFKADGVTIDDERVSLLNRLVIAHFLEDMKGCITLKIPFDFKARSQWRVPYWFAKQHPTKMVVRG